MPTEPDISSLRLLTPRLILRPLSADDRDEWIRVHRVSAAEFAAWGPQKPLEQSIEQFFEFSLDRARSRAADGTRASLVARLHDHRPGNAAEGPLVGLFNLNNIVRGVFQNADAGWSVSTDAAGRGLGTEGVLGLLDLAFGDPARGGLGLHRVQANVQPGNLASIRLAQKCGFRREGIGLRMLKIAGDWRDHINFAKLSDEHAPAFLRD
jgi:[ribosomal protein S5]-alanine N-acetyltransferase